MKKLLALMVCGMVFSVGAEAASINVLGGITSGGPSVSGIAGSTYKSGTGITYGATVDFGMMPAFAIETGILSVGKKFTQTTAGVGAVVTTRAYEVPLLLRFTALPILDFGGGVYYQSYNSTYDAEALGVKTTGNSWSAAGLKSTDFGLKLSARLLLPIAPMLHFVIDGAYKMGLANMSSNSGATWKNNEIDALGGISIGF